MNRKNTENPDTAGTDVHLDALGEFLTQLRTHLTDSAASKGTYGDYLRLLEFYRESRGEQIRELIRFSHRGRAAAREGPRRPEGWELRMD
jgi:hypothetical protein